MKWIKRVLALIMLHLHLLLRILLILQIHNKVIMMEMGKTINFADKEVDTSADILEYYAKNGEPFLKTTPLRDAKGAEIVSEPFGVILAIEPWNFPFYQLARVAGPQLVAGNVVIAKHAPSVPQCALAFEKLFTDAGAPAGVE